MEIMDRRKKAGWRTGRRPTHCDAPVGYPSVREHLLSRRDMMSTLGRAVIVGAGALSVGCVLNDRRITGAAGDASPLYWTIRLPLQETYSVTLADSAQCRFFMSILTYSEDTYNYFINHEVEVEQACVDALRPYSYDSLNSAVGVQDAESDVRDALNALSAEIAQATLSILELLP
jgi:hypothetical protein